MFVIALVGTAHGNRVITFKQPTAYWKERSQGYMWCLNARYVLCQGSNGPWIVEKNTWNNIFLLAVAFREGLNAKCFNDSLTCNEKVRRACPNGKKEAKLFDSRRLYRLPWPTTANFPLRRKQGSKPNGHKNKDFYVLLTVQLGITLVNDQLDAQFFYFIIRLLQSSTCFEQRHAHHQEVKLY